MRPFPITITTYIAYAVYAQTIDFSQFVNCQNNILCVYVLGIHMDR